MDIEKDTTANAPQGPRHCFRCGQGNALNTQRCAVCGSDLGPVLNRYMVAGLGYPIATFTNQAGTFYRFDQHVAVIGRSVQCDWVLSGKSVSRFHAELFFSAADRGWLLRDLDSGNGTFINNDQLQGKSSLSRLKEGDEVKFGSEQYRFAVVYITESQEW